MKDIIQIISNLEGMRFIKPASTEEIKSAEAALNVKFASDYVRYVEKYGVISARGIELTGVTRHERLSVVCVTNKERSLNAKIPSNMYVIENIAIDGMLALQDESGKIYMITPNGNPELKYNSLCEYVENSKF
ncbi:SMI1/KNR4 family protein [Luxibacter massiliensis]|uniref:SMI1/KNR4 family protein n=1 Tax=Luxibacter massiliensis TaxID=2219695 RepID=UPI000F04D2C0|nr:SMI1/KNR4 family protein [Luxibacter massiliensis]